MNTQNIVNVIETIVGKWQVIGARAEQDYISMYIYLDKMTIDTVKGAVAIATSGHDWNTDVYYSGDKEVRVVVTR